MTHIIRLGNWYVKSVNYRDESVTITKNIHQAKIFSVQEKDIALPYVTSGGLNPKTVDMK